MGCGGWEGDEEGQNVTEKEKGGECWCGETTVQGRRRDLKRAECTSTGHSGPAGICQPRKQTQLSL